MKTRFVELPISTRDGKFLARYSEKGLAELHFPQNGNRRAGADPNTRVPADQNVAPKIHTWHRITETALKKNLAGQKSEKLPPIDFSRGTEFQRSVWRELRKISSGKTKSYGEIAQAIGKPKAVRAVGGACGKNPIPVLVPCHRILAANKRIGGFSGGLDWKRELLSREGIVL